MPRRNADFPISVRAAKPARADRSNAYSHLSWACGGFLIGAVCWHMIGFWGFIDRVLTETGPHRVVSTTASGNVVQNPGGKKVSARLGTDTAGSDCVSVIQAGAGATHVTPCLQPVVAMRDDLATRTFVGNFRPESK